MKGHIAFDHLTHLVSGSVDENGWVAMAVEFRMQIDDVDAFWNGDHVGSLGGVVVCKELGTCKVTEGSFHLLYPIEGNTRHQHMSYHLHFEDGDGHPLTLNGYKEVVTGDFTPLEHTTATLTRILDGTVDYTDKWTTDAIASGVLRISPLGTVTQLFTYRSSQAGPFRATLTTLNFIRRFFVQLWKVYGFHGSRRTAFT
jgi:hypothetical protein